VSVAYPLAQPHHDGSAGYVSDAAPTLGQTVSVWLRVPAAAGVDRVFVRSTPDGEPRFSPAVVDRTGSGQAWWRAEVEVRNPVSRYRFLVDGPAGPRWLNALGVFGHDVPDAVDFRLLAFDPPPPWSQDTIVYEIFPDRFARSARAAARPRPEWAIPCGWDDPVIGRGPETPYQFYGGDLDGIVDHLDHIASLGANTLYLTPVFPARSNHRYDASSFTEVDPMLGGDAALTRLTAAAHDRGLRVLGDLTPNHCGEAHPWFRAARADPAAPERQMFFFDGDDYECWCGIKSLPKLNWRSPQLRDRFFDGPDSIVARWLRPPYGLDGWRVDVANMTGRLRGESLTREVARRLRRTAVAARPDALVVAEHAHDASVDLDADGWHATMNYAGFLRPLWSWLRPDELDLPDFLGVPGDVPRRGGVELAATMRAFAALVSWRTWTNGWTLLGSHDTARIESVVGDAGRVDVAAALLLTLPGVPMIFAGDEIGLAGRNGEGARRTMPWHRPDSWNRGRLATYRRLIELRRDTPALRHGGLRWAHADADSVAFLRETPTETVLIHARRAAGAPLTLRGLPGGTAENLYGGAGALRVTGGSAELPGEGPAVQVWRMG
jgi:alpha-glucosidase